MHATVLITVIFEWPFWFVKMSVLNLSLFLTVRNNCNPRPRSTQSKTRCKKLGVSARYYNPSQNGQNSYIINKKTSRFKKNKSLIIIKSGWFFFNICRKFPKYSDTQRISCNHSKIWTMWLYHRVMSPNDADGMANSVDTDQTAPLGAVWSASTLFAQTCLSENLRSLRYAIKYKST